MCNSKEDVLNIVDMDGYVWSHRFTDDEDIYLSELVSNGVLENLEDAGIKFMNGTYCYVRKGNPKKVHVIDNERTGVSYLAVR